MLKYILLLLTAWPLAAADLYVWQRQRSAELNDQIRNFYQHNSGKLAFWAGEIENNGRIHIMPPPEAVDFSRAVAVVRIHVKQLEVSPEVLAGKIIGIYQAWQQCNALQIDLDAPESKLDYYRALIMELRKKLPGVTLSATVLPCHIRHTRKFAALVRSCDYYVLQVHGLDRAGGRWFIMDGKIARDAIARAEKLALPYQLALPLYAHTVKGGQLVQPDLKLTAELAARSKNVIGFRLGLPGEKEALSLKSAMAICKGQYEPSVKLQWELHSNGAWLLKLTNNGFFVQKIECSFALPEDVQISDMDSFGAALLDYEARKFTVDLPPDGITQKILWLRTNKKTDLSRVKDFTITMKEL